MSWQRIDENTYIDDTLVTCAEYQLFIDEMREQGKYYQPDHWPAYQFTTGQAREPILGVRHSDAVALGEWLTYREASEWHYRLPTNQEANAHILEKVKQDPVSLGYWIIGAKGLSRFDWIDPEHNNVGSTKKANDIILNVSVARALASNFDHAFEYAKPTGTLAQLRELVHVLDLTHRLAREHALVHEFTPDLNQARSRAHNLPSNFYIDYANVPYRLAAIIGNINRLRKHAQNLVMNRTRDLDSLLRRTHSFVLDIDYVRDFRHTLDPRFKHIFDIDRNSQRAPDLNRAREFACDLALSHKHDLNRILLVYGIIFTLQERIAGRSPAFEGIRLVKERK